MKLTRFEPTEWAIMAENAHAACFHEKRSPEMNRIDFALLALDNDDKPLCYTTFRETDAESVYMAYGGSFPSAKGTCVSFSVYGKIHEYLSERYKRASTLISNGNVPMLKFALKANMKIIGTRTVAGETYVELMREYQDGSN